MATWTPTFAVVSSTASFRMRVPVPCFQIRSQNLVLRSLRLSVFCASQRISVDRQFWGAFPETSYPLDQFLRGFEGNYRVPKGLALAALDEMRHFGPIPPFFGKKDGGVGVACSRWQIRSMRMGGTAVSRCRGAFLTYLAPTGNRVDLRSHHGRIFLPRRALQHRVGLATFGSART